MKRFYLSLFAMYMLLPMMAINLKVGGTYTCDIGSISGLQACFWTISDTKALEFVYTPNYYNTSVSVRAIAYTGSHPIVVHCEYSWIEPNPTNPRFNYTRTGYRDWTFYVENNGPQSIVVSPSQLTIDVGEYRHLNATVSPSTADQTVTWRSNSGAVEVGSSSGRVFGNYSGSATITATTSNGLTASCYVTVRKVDPISVSISSPAPIKIGQTVSIRPQLYPENASTTFNWSSNASSIASVDNNGNVTGHSEGTAIITVSTSNGKSASCEVQVYKPVPSSISFSSSNIKIPVGDTKTLSYSVQPSDAIYSVKWSSEDRSIAEVNNGVVTAKKPGSTYVVVTTDNGKSDKCLVTVPPQPSEIIILPKEVELLMGRNKQLSYTLKPEGAMARTLTWSTSDYAVASIDQNGKVIARKPGNTTITLTADNGCVGRCNLTVPEPVYQLFLWTKNGYKTGYLSTDEPEFSYSDEVIHFRTKNMSLKVAKDDFDKFTIEQVLPEHPTSITMPSEMMVGLNRSKSISYVMNPVNAETQLTWFNTEPTVVDVTQSGIVKGLQVGTSLVTLQTSNGLRAQCIVTVPEPKWIFFIWLRNGGKVGYGIDEKPEVTLGDSTFNLVTSNLSVQYLAEQVLQFTLEDAAIVTHEDINQDSHVDTQDVLGIYEFIRTSKPVTPSTVYDVNHDGVVDTQDVLRVYERIQNK